MREISTGESLWRVVAFISACGGDLGGADGLPGGSIATCPGPARAIDAITATITVAVVAFLLFFC